MKRFLTILVTGLALTATVYAAKIQKQGIKTEAECIAGGATAANCLTEDAQIYVTANSLNKKLSAAITDGDIGGGGSGVSVNQLANPSAKNNVLTWTASGGTFVRTTTSGEFRSSPAAFSFDAGATAQTVTADAWAVPASSTMNGYATCSFKTTATDYLFEVYDGTNVVATQTIAANTAFTKYELTFVAVASTSYSLRLNSQSNAAEINWDDCYFGENPNLINVQQPTMHTVRFPFNAACNWQKSTNNTNSFAADTDCPAPSGANITGSLSAAATQIPAVVWNNAPPGHFEVKTYFQGDRPAAVNDQCSWYVKSSVADADGVSLSMSGGQYHDSSLLLRAAITPTHAFKYNSSNSSIQFEIVVAASGGVNCGLGNTTSGAALQIQVTHFPLGPSVVTTSQQRAPTVQRLTSGTTYTRPNGAVMLKVKMVGGGGGGSGSGTASVSSNGTAGTSTTFGSSLLTATGGGGANWSGSSAGTPGSGTVSAPAINIASHDGQYGQSGPYKEIGTVQAPGGHGGNTVLGRGGFGVLGSTGGAAASNTGGGGAGGGANSNGGGLGYYTGGGGGSGGYVEALILNPESSYAYVIGAAGSNGSAGTNGTAGGSGGSGVIIVEEFYSFANAPIVIGSVTSSSSGAERIERASVETNCTSTPCTIARQSGDWLTSISRTSTGIYTLNFKSGYYTAAPSCFFTPGDDAETAIRQQATATTTTYSFRSRDIGNAVADNSFDIMCMGPR